MIQWEHRINGPLPRRLEPPPWPGIRDERDAVKAADCYLSLKKGQAFIAEGAMRIEPLLWEVSINFTTAKGFRPEQAPHLPASWAVPGRHAAGKLWVDGVTGTVTDSLEEARNAIAARS